MTKIEEMQKLNLNEEIKQKTKKPKNQLMSVFKGKGPLKKVLFNEDEIKKEVARIAREIDRMYGTSSKKLVLVGILKGAFVFLSDLSRMVKTPHEIDFMAVSSYHNTESTGEIEIRSDLRDDIRDKHVLIVEDIVDTGQTIDRLMEMLQTRHPASLRICSMLRKPTEMKSDRLMDFVGFDVDPPEFVIGYGLDYNEYFRGLPVIGVPTDETIEKYAI